jgi:hypothetical protein
LVHQFRKYLSVLVFDYHGSKSSGSLGRCWTSGPKAAGFAVLYAQNLELDGAGNPGRKQGYMSHTLEFQKDLHIIAREERAQAARKVVFTEFLHKAQTVAELRQLLALVCNAIEIDFPRVAVNGGSPEIVQAMEHAAVEAEREFDRDNEEPKY